MGALEACVTSDQSIHTREESPANTYHRMITVFPYQHIHHSLAKEFIQSFIWHFL